MRWKTEKIKKLLAPFAAKIVENGQGGDYDSNNLLLTAKGAKRDNHLFICGFHCEQTCTTPDDMEAEMVEVTDGQDSQGGLNTSDHATAIMYAEVCTALRKAGFTVVPRLKDYF